MIEGVMPPPPQEAVKPPVVPQAARQAETGASATDVTASTPDVENPHAANWVFHDQASEQPGQIETPTAERSLKDLQILGLDFKDKSADALVQEAAAQGWPDDESTKQAIEQSLRLFRAQEALQQLHGMGVALEGQTADTLTHVLHDQHGWQDDEQTRQYVEGALQLQEERIRAAAPKQGSPTTAGKKAETPGKRPEAAAPPESKEARNKRQTEATFQQTVLFVNDNTSAEMKDANGELVRALNIDAEARSENSQQVTFKNEKGEEVAVGGKFQVGTDRDGRPRIVDVHTAIKPIMDRLEQMAGETVTGQDGKPHPTPQALQAKKYLGELKPRLTQKKDKSGYYFETGDRPRTQRVEQVDPVLTQADGVIQRLVEQLKGSGNKQALLQLLIAQRSGGAGSDRTLVHAFKYGAIVAGYRNLTPEQQRAFTLPSELLETMKDQQRTVTQHVVQACTTGTSGLSDENAQALAGVLTSGGMAEFAAPLLRVIEEGPQADGKFSAAQLAGLNPLQREILEKPEVAGTFNTAFFGNKDGVSMEWIETQTQGKLDEGERDEYRKIWTTRAKYTGVIGSIGLFLLMQSAQSSEKTEQQLLQQQ